MAANLSTVASAVEEATTRYLGWDMLSQSGSRSRQRSLLMAIVAGVDFGTLSVRVSLVDSERGLLESAIAEYPLHRKREDPEYATPIP